MGCRINVYSHHIPSTSAARSSGELFALLLGGSCCRTAANRKHLWKIHKQEALEAEGGTHIAR